MGPQSIKIRPTTKAEFGLKFLLPQPSQVLQFYGWSVMLLNLILLQNQDIHRKIVQQEIPSSSFINHIQRKKIKKPQRWKFSIQEIGFAIMMGQLLHIKAELHKLTQHQG